MCGGACTPNLAPFGAGLLLDRTFLEHGDGESVGSLVFVGEYQLKIQTWIVEGFRLHLQA
jgi:hypothetical protein